MSEKGRQVHPPYQIIIEKWKWIRAERGGFMQFHTQPGDLIEKDQLLATNTTLLGHERSRLHAPFDAVVVSMTSLPAVSPGEPVFNLSKLPTGQIPSELLKLREEENGLGLQLSEELGSSVTVIEPAED